MIDPKNLDELSRRLFDNLPMSQDLERLGEDLRKNLRATLAAGLSRLDLVDRETFDVQRAVLQRTREKLEALEARVRAMEAERADEPPES